MAAAEYFEINQSITVAAFCIYKKKGPCYSKFWMIFCAGGNCTKQKSII